LIESLTMYCMSSLFPLLNMLLLCCRCGSKDCDVVSLILSTQFEAEAKKNKSNETVVVAGSMYVGIGDLIVSRIKGIFLFGLCI